MKAIVVREKYIRFAIAALNDVMGYVGNHNARKARHAYIPKKVTVTFV
jgi:hypothetical protein